MSNADAHPNVSGNAMPQHMGAGSFFGAIHGKREQCGAIFTGVRHSLPRKLPMHSHELKPEKVGHLLSIQRVKGLRTGPLAFLKAFAAQPPRSRMSTRDNPLQPTGVSTYLEASCVTSSAPS
jgi:hypothetical protein